MRARNGFRWWILATVLILGAVVFPLLDHRDSSSTLVVYCAHDAVFADSIIRLFEQKTGIRVDVRYDEEASKSLGLTNLLIAEKSAPRCDVFWNNQTLGTIRLQNQGVLQPYRGNGFQRIPDVFRDAEGHWVSFAARMRVIIINTERMPEADDAVHQAFESGDLSDAAIAVPLYGTTLTHYSVLNAENGLEKLKEWHRSLRDRGIREVRGNGAVRDLVAAGACRIGFTDTDDVFGAIDDGRPVRMIPARTESGRTIVIPNSVAMIAGCRHPREAEQFIDFLLSEEVELLLAKSSSRQIPLGPIPDNELPEDVVLLKKWAADAVSMEPAAERQDEVLNWLMSESHQP